MKPFIIRVIIVVVLCILQPFLWSFVKARAVELQDKRSRAQQIEEVQKRNAAISQNINEQKEYLRQLDVIIPPHNSLTAIVDKLEKLGDQGRVTVTFGAINDSAANKGELSGGIAPVVLSLSAVGSLGQVFNYLENVEHLQELSAVTAWSLREAPIQPVPNSTPQTTGGALTTTMRYELTLDLQFYFKQDNL